MKKHWFFLTFILFYTILVSYKIIAFPTPFYDWDEPMYVQSGIEMLRSGFFLAPVWLGKPWLDKPPISSLLYGLITLLPFPAEISTRLFVLFVSVILLTFLYILYRRVTKRSTIATLSVIGTAFATIFLQRSQVVNLDVLLLMGWLGYLVFIKRPFVAVLFLLLSVQSKSLLGFYPLAIYAIVTCVEFLRHEISKSDVKKRILILVAQISFLSAWYLIMLFLYGKSFWQIHIIESHFMRVTASIESHFGQRTFYIDLLLQELRFFIIPALIGFVLLTYEWLTKKRSTMSFAFAAWFIPWFLFLNLTKTKISWYLYPIIPQFFFLAMYPLILIKKWKILFIIVSVMLCFYFLYTGVKTNNFLNTRYSQWEDHQKIALVAKNKCSSLGVLVSPETRSTYETLKKMGLVIQTTDMWGDHPSMVYYFGKPMDFFYSIKEMQDKERNFECFAIPTSSSYFPENAVTIKTYPSMQLLKKTND